MKSFTTKIDRKELLAIILANRKKHIAQYEEAVKNFKEKYIERLLTYIDNVKNGGKPELYIQLRQPECHLDDYDAIIRMLEMSSEQNIEIGYENFECFVLDRWQWKSSFFDNTLSYLHR